MSEDKINITVPKECTNNASVIFKIQDKTPLQKVQKFRSFCFQTSGNSMPIKNKTIGTKHLFNILVAHGLPENIPIVIDSNTGEFSDFDWRPHAYGGPTVWYFYWNGTECSITC